METQEIIGQACGIVGLLLAVYSFQEKSNTRFFIFQALTSLMFFLNFWLIGAISGALFNIASLIRGLLLAKNGKRVWKLVFIEAMLTACFVYSLMQIVQEEGFALATGWLGILLSGLTFVSLLTITVFMWRGNGKHIRYVQFFFNSPAWILYNSFNFTLGGIICEAFNMISIIVSFIRYGKNGFEGAAPEMQSEA